tara:strand:+ start:961 stop:1197 length:237 start_codon:yes stop_codon:yes gene_type:complete
MYATGVPTTTITITLMTLVTIESLIACMVVGDKMMVKTEADDAALIMRANKGNPIKQTYIHMINIPSVWLGLFMFRAV